MAFMEFAEICILSLVWEPWSDSQASWQKDLQQHGQRVLGEKEEGPELIFTGGSDQDVCLFWILPAQVFDPGVLRAEFVLQLLLNPEMVKACPMLLPYVYDFLENKAYSKGKGEFARKVRNPTYRPHAENMLWS